MQVTIDISDEVVSKAQAEGLAVEEYIRRKVEDPPAFSTRPGFVRLGPGTKTPEEAGASIREIASRSTLGGLRIKDLINEGRRY